jgi:hypothetical protein
MIALGQEIKTFINLFQGKDYKFEQIFRYQHQSSAFKVEKLKMI